MALARRRPLPAAAAAAAPRARADARASARPPAPPPLWLALRLPAFALQVFGGTATPFAVLAGEGAQRTVVAANAAATALGVRAGHGVSAALALAPTLALAPRAPAREAAALARLAGWAQQFTPLVSVEAPDALLLEVRGSLKLFGGLAALIARLQAALLPLGYSATLAVAPTPRAALWFARAGQDQRLDDPAALPGALGALPLAALGLEPGLTAVLAGIGVTRVRDALRLPRGDLGRRYGPQLRAELDRALGRQPEPRAAFVAPPRFRGELEMPYECSAAGPLAVAAARLTAELCGGLAARGSGVRRLLLTLEHRAGIEAVAPTTLPLGLLAPTRDPRHLDRLLAEHLARTPLAGPVRALRLEALEVEALDAAPLPLFDELFDVRHAAARDPIALIETLRARLGAGRVHGLALVADHRPELAWRVADGEIGIRVNFVAAGVDSSTDQTKLTLMPISPRPTWLLAEPQPLAALRGRPRWRGAELALEQGPERIESGWWDGADVARDYYRARAADGGELWVFRTRQKPAAWFLQGFFA
jgi:protein ImuB